MQEAPSKRGSFLILCQINRLAGQHGFVAVQLGDQLQGRVHTEHRHACVHGDDVPVGHVGRYGAAAALVYLAQRRDLPDDARLVQRGADMPHGLGGSVGGAPLPREPVYLQMATP